MFYNLLQRIDELAADDFELASSDVIRYVDTCDDFISLITQIGTIPECIEHDATQEKLFSKASDAVLARAFREIGLKATVLKARGDSADVQAESFYHGYTLVADAKAFRMSRTAKNQKDFKVNSLSGWRKDADYAVLCSPYFQYPTRKSQIYAQAVDNNVCLISWEHLIFLITNGIKETENTNFSALWNISGEYAQRCTVAQKQNCFISVVDAGLAMLGNMQLNEFENFLGSYQNHIEKRAEVEIGYWINQKQIIETYSREQAIEELIQAKKINEKIAQIKKYVAGIQL